MAYLCTLSDIDKFALALGTRLVDWLSNKIRKIMNVTELVLLSYILLLPPSPQLIVFRSMVNFLRWNPILIIRFTVGPTNAFSNLGDLLVLLRSCLAQWHLVWLCVPFLCIHCFTIWTGQCEAVLPRQSFPKISLDVDQHYSIEFRLP